MVDQPRGAFGREKWRVVGVRVRPPGGVATGVQQNGGAGHVQGSQRTDPDATLGALLHAHHDGGQVDDAGERKGGQVDPVRVAVERRIEIGAGVATMLTRSMANSVPGALGFRESSRVRCGVTSGPGSPGYVFIPAVMT